MPSEFYWYFNGPDGEFPWVADGVRRIPNGRHLRTLATALEELPFTGALAATSLHEPLVAAGLLLGSTTRTKVLAAAYAGLIAPDILARMAAGLDDLYGDRLVINMINSETPVLRQYGIHLENEDRYAMALRYWEDFGESYRRLRALQDREQPQPAGDPGPREPVLWFSGSSEAALPVAVRHASNFLSFAEPPAQLAEKIGRVGALARAEGRSTRFGITATIIARPSSEEAWSVAAGYLRRVPAESIRNRVSLIRKGGKSGGRSVSASRISGHFTEAQLEAAAEGKPAQDPREYLIAPTLWAGNALLWHGAQTAIVGSYDEVAATIRDYEAIGVDTFIVFGYPLVEQAYVFAQEVIPRVGRSSGAAAERPRRAQPD